MFEAEEKFKDFAKNGYDPNYPKIEDIEQIVSQFAVYLVPWEGVPTWVEQDRRKRQWPWVMSDLVKRVTKDNYDLREKNKALQNQLIETKKELSRLKREKK